METEGRVTLSSVACSPSLKAKLALNQTMVKPPLLPSCVIDSLAHSAVGSRRDDPWCARILLLNYDLDAPFLFFRLCGNLLFSHYKGIKHETSRLL